MGLKAQISTVAAEAGHVIVGGFQRPIADTHDGQVQPLASLHRPRLVLSTPGGLIVAGTCQLKRPISTLLEMLRAWCFRLASGQGKPSRKRAGTRRQQGREDFSAHRRSRDATRGSLEGGRSHGDHASRLQEHCFGIFSLAVSCVASVRRTN